MGRPILSYWLPYANLEVKNLKYEQKNILQTKF